MLLENKGTSVITLMTERQLSGAGSRERCEADREVTVECSNGSKYRMKCQP
jgi:hypothetical protein